MKPFQFRDFTIKQHRNVFRVGTDGVLLGALATVSDATKILEVGTGSGIISLMAAQRNPNAEIVAIDFNPEAVNLAVENFKISPFSKRLRAIHEDYKTYEPSEKFDLIISNPPYFEENPSGKDVTARQHTALSFQELISKSSQVLTEQGIFSVIIPHHAGDYFKKKCHAHQLFLNRQINIFGIKNAAPKRLILEFRINKGLISQSDFIIEKSSRIYSDQYLEATKNFHIFGKKEII